MVREVVHAKRVLNLFLLTRRVDNFAVCFLTSFSLAQTSPVSGSKNATDMKLQRLNEISS